MRSGKAFLRALWAPIAVSGVILTLWPMGERAYGLWSQHSLRAAWQQQMAAPRDGNSARRGDKRNSKAMPWPATELVIEDIGVSAVVVQGVGADSLRRGPGHHPTSALPGQPGNCVIAAHRNAYGWWFYNLGKVGSGASIQLRNAGGTYHYRVLSTRKVQETDLSIMRAPQGASAKPRLTLYTCTQPRSDQRIVVTAELVETRSL